MRNLKRALSLALASVMLLGMMVVGSSAKGLDDFSDNAEIVNKDAVAVTSAIGLFDGYEDGSFGPENVVTRAEMAVIICTMLYGAGVNVNQFAETNVFTDVPAWAQGYVNLCSSLGIVAGVGDGKFDPNATVTTAQAVLMLCRALGYFQSAADFGSDWMLAATAKGTALGLYGDLKLTANEGLTRDNVAELVFNALTKAVPVQYNELLGVYYNENQGIIYSLEFNYLQTLFYKNFVLVYRTDTETIYGRPATTWGTGSYRGTSATTEGNDSYGLNEDGSLKSSFAKFMTEEEMNGLVTAMAGEPGDLLLFAADKNKVVWDVLGNLRLELARQMDLLDKNVYNFLWVTEFPLLEFNEDLGRYQAMHHPFTMPMEEDLEFLESDPGRVRAQAYDIVLNGTEIGGGSIRIHQNDIQERMFEALGFTKEAAYNQFGFLLNAFKYGVPPHAGLAYGLDRLVMLMAKEDSIREVIAFPKVKDASCLMTEAPNLVDPAQLEELGIAVVKEETDSEE